MASIFKASISKVQKNATTHDTVVVKVAITNTSDQDVSVLTWNTPLDRLITDCFAVTVDGKPVEYDGPMVKRAAPTASDYLVIKAGQTVEAEYPVSDAYDTSKPGNYLIKLKTPIPDAAPELAGAAESLAAATRPPVTQRMSASTKIKIEQGQGAHLTLGAAARKDEKLIRPALKTATMGSRKAAGLKKTPIRKRGRWRP
jgi:hypothetical protein